MMKKTQEASGFAGLGIVPSLLKMLDSLGYENPTPIQQQAIPVVLSGQDVFGIAQTGTGKTLAFGLPMIQMLPQHKGKGLVVLPTRELAVQVEESLREVGAKFGLRTAVLIGGEPIGKQYKALKADPHIIVATPGRLLDHAEQRTVDLSKTKTLVLDEADMMLDMGFLPQIKRILKLVPSERQTMLFSATMPGDIVGIATEYMKTPIRIEVAPAGTSSENVEQELIVVRKEEKFAELERLLKENDGTMLIFLRTKHTVKGITRKINTLGYKAAEIHSNRSQSQRQQALQGFKEGKYQILVATDIAARGIDVKGIGLVINYDLPEKSGDYVHRIGRTGRADRTGRAISFVLPAQIRDVKEIEKLIRKKLTINKNEEELKELYRDASIEEKILKIQKNANRRSSSGRRMSPVRSGGNTASERPKPAYRGGSIVNYSKPKVVAKRPAPAPVSRSARPNKSAVASAGLSDFFPESSDPLAPSKERIYPSRERRGAKPRDNKRAMPKRPERMLTDRERFQRSMRGDR